MGDFVEKVPAMSDKAVPLKSSEISYLFELASYYTIDVKKEAHLLW